MLLMGKSTISMAIFNSYVSHYQRVTPQVYRPCQEVVVFQLQSAGRVDVGRAWDGYPLVNIQKAMENHHVSWEN